MRVLTMRRHPLEADGPTELDAITLARAARGDLGAQTRLIECYQRRLFALVGRLLVSHPDLVEDVVQDTFLQALGALGRFDAAGPGRLSTWLLTIGTRVALDRLRRRATERRSVPYLRAADSSGDSAEAAAHARALGRRVEAAMARLPDDHRAVLVLRAYHDMDYPDIAAALGLELGTVKSRLARARAALQLALGDPA